MEDKGKTLDNAVKLFSRITEEQKKSILKSLKERIIIKGISQNKISKVTGLNTYESGLLEKILSSDINEKELTLIFESLYKYENILRRNTEDISIIWTGPVDFLIHQKTTLSTIIEMIDSANKNVSVVGYSINKESEKVMFSLSKAMRRGVKVRIIGNDLENQIKEIIKIWPAGEELPKMYTRPKDEKDTMAALHAKLICVDCRDLLITSANLTYHGLKKNIEMGIRVKGCHSASQVEQFLDTLIINEHVRKFEATS